jgi:hypothetical protein
MSNKLSFGKHEGRTFEWLFFNKPAYAQWLYDNDIHLQDERMTEQEGEYFLELYRRATNLGGICCQCKEWPVTRMGLTTHFRSHDISAVGFFCEECEYQGGSRAGFYHPSFIVAAYTVSAGDQKMILSEVRRHYLGESGRFTQSKMEEFFGNDANFSDCTPGFFTTTAA